MGTPETERLKHDGVLTQRQYVTELIETATTTVDVLFPNVNGIAWAWAQNQPMHRVGPGNAKVEGVGGQRHFCLTPGSAPTNEYPWEYQVESGEGRERGRTQV